MAPTHGATGLGANRDFLLHRIPHISQLLVDDLDEVVGHADVVVVGNADPAFRDVVQDLRPDQVLIDLVRVSAEPPRGPGYEGIAW